jgi:hypothetical protein
MNVPRLVPLEGILEALLRYATNRLHPGNKYLQRMLAEPPPGRDVLGVDEKLVALRWDSLLRRFGVHCLWRAAVVTDMLRNRGVQSRVRLSVSRSNPSHAHAECEVGDQSLHSMHVDMVPFRERHSRHS